MSEVRGAAALLEPQIKNPKSRPIKAAFLILNLHFYILRGGHLKVISPFYQNGKRLVKSKWQVYTYNMKNEENKPNTIGARIKAARDERGLSQADLAKELGFQTATAISLIEDNKRKVTAGILQKLSEVLHRDIKYFLGQDEGAAIDVQVALRADPDLTTEDKDAILRFIDLAKEKAKKNNDGE